MAQNIVIRNIKKDLLNPVVLVHWVEGQSDLIKLSLGQYATQTVIYYLKVLLGQFSGLFAPNISKLSLLECDGLQFFTLLLVIHSTEDDLVAIGFAGEFQW